MGEIDRLDRFYLMFLKQKPRRSFQSVWIAAPVVSHSKTFIMKRNSRHWISYYGDWNMYYSKKHSLLNTLVGAAAMALVSVTATAAQTNTGGAMSTDSSRAGERLSDQGMNPHRDVHSEAGGHDTRTEGSEPGDGSVDSATKGHPMSDHGMAHVRGETEGTMGSDDFDGKNDRPDPRSLSVDSAASGDKSSNYGMEATKPYSGNVNVDPQSHMHAGPHPEK